MLLRVFQFIHINVIVVLAQRLAIVNHLVPFLQAWFAKHWGICHSALASWHMAQLLLQPQRLQHQLLHCRQWQQWQQFGNIQPPRYALSMLPYISNNQNKHSPEMQWCILDKVTVKIRNVGTGGFAEQKEVKSDIWVSSLESCSVYLSFLWVSTRKTWRNIRIKSACVLVYLIYLRLK